MWSYTIDLKLMGDDVALAYRRAGFKVKTHTFFYNFPQLTAVNLNDRASTLLSIDQDSLYVVLALSHYKRQADTRLTALLGCGLKITDLQNSYTFGDVDLVPSEAIAGSGEAPSILPFPYILVPGSKVRAEIVNLNGATVFAGFKVDLFLCLIGLKLITTPFTKQIIMPEA